MPSVFFKRTSSKLDGGNGNEKTKKTATSSSATTCTNNNVSPPPSPTLPLSPTSLMSTLRGLIKSTQCEVVKTDVLIVGNGPSGMALSYMLNGNVPYFSKANGPHPTQIYNSMLKESISLFDQDLESVSEGLTGRSKSPISILFDSLRQPRIDFDWDHKTRVVFNSEPFRKVDHLIIGSGEPGGVWNNMQNDMLTVSYGDWMDLPGYSLLEWMSTQNETQKIDPSKERVLRKYVTDYYRSYPANVGIEDNFMNNCTVLSIALEEEVDCKFLCKKSCTCFKYKYALKVQRNDTKALFWVRCNNVVFASGVYDRPRTLDFPGNSLPNVFNNMKTYLEADLVLQNHNNPLPVVVIGSGLSAGDAILHLMERNIPVIHIYYKHRGVSPLSKCPKASYPEYAKLYQMMKECIKTPLYEPYPDADIISFDKEGNAVISYENQEMDITASAILLLIGSEVSLNVISSPKLQETLLTDYLEIDSFSFEIEGTDGIYAIGSLANDNFVRFAVGSSFGVARSLYRKRA